MASRAFGALQAAAKKACGKPGGLKPVTDSDIAAFKQILAGTTSSGAPGAISSHPQIPVITDSDQIAASYATDWLRQVSSADSVKCVLLPQTTEHVSKLLQYCNEHRIGVVPQGGNTGMVQGSIPVFDEVVLSTKCLYNKLMRVDADGMVARCGAGVVLQDLYDECELYQMVPPLDLGARGSCQIGGNLATNAGGVHVVRFGSLRANTLGLEAVLPSGEVIDVLSSLRKDNTGYDLKNLFIGAEGTLGVITQADLALHRRCPDPCTTLVAVDSNPEAGFDPVLRTVAMARNFLGETLNAIEVMDVESVHLLQRAGMLTKAAESMPMLQAAIDATPFPLGSCSTAVQSSKAESDQFKPMTNKFFILIETAGCEREHDVAKMNKFLSAAMGASVIVDGVVASASRESELMWSLRHGIPQAGPEVGDVYKFDLSYPTAHFYDVVDTVRQKIRTHASSMGKDVFVVGYGHLGDGNLHLNLIDASAKVGRTGGEVNEKGQTWRDVVESVITPEVYKQTAELNGSASAEHGVGVLKKKYLPLCKKQPAIELMKSLKGLLDPQGIMNPYKVL